MALYIVLHTGKSSGLDDVLRRCDGRDVRWAEDSDPIQSAVFLAPPGRHLLLGPETVTLSDAPAPRHWRPSIDLLFQSATESFGKRAIGIILSGLLDDGVAGMRSIKQAGGTLVIKERAEYSDMPDAVRKAAPVDLRLSIQGITEFLNTLGSRRNI